MDIGVVKQKGKTSLSRRRYPVENDGFGEAVGMPIDE